MFIKNWKKEIFSVPNMLSLFRLLIIPVYIEIYLNAKTPRQYAVAGSIVILSCLTDMLDGKIARRYNMITTLGKILDPLADKITQLALVLCLNRKHPELDSVVALFLVKELFQVMVAIINLRRGRILSGALMAGKICTTVLFISLILLVIFPNMDSIYIRLIAYTDVIFLTISFICYILAYLDKDSKFEDIRHH